MINMDFNGTGWDVFPNNEALMKTICLAAIDFTRKWTMRIPNWGMILAQF